MRCNNTKHYSYLMPFLDFNSIQDLSWFLRIFDGFESSHFWREFISRKNLSKNFKKILKKLVKSLLAQHKSQQDWSFERVPTCKLSNVKVVCLQRAGAKNARYSAQLSAPHRSKSKFPPKTKFRKKTREIVTGWQILNTKQIKSSEICIRFFWTFVISMKTNYFSADFSDLKPLCIMPATQAHASLLSLGRQKFCLEVEEEY